MNFLDFLFALTLIVSIAVGAWRGWMPQVLTLTALALTLLAVMKLGPLIAPHLPLSGPGEAIRVPLGAFLAMVVTLYLAHKLVQLHRYVFPRQGKQPAHRALGALFGVASGVMVLLVLSLIIDATELRDRPWWVGSVQERAAGVLITSVKSVLAL